MPVFKFNPWFVFLFMFLWWFVSGRQLLVAFSLVIIHELAHAVVARIKGFPIRKIEILPIGGAAEYTGFLEMYPSAEICVALAGPMLNLLLVPLLYFLQRELFLRYSLILAVFNLLPVLPLDGGRVVRAIFIRTRGFKLGMQTALKLSRGSCFILFVTGLLMIAVNYLSAIFVITAFFVYYSIRIEKEQFYFRLQGYLLCRKEKPHICCKETAVTRVVTGALFVEELAVQLSPEKYDIFYVVDQQYQIKTVLTETDLLEAFFSLEDRNLRLMDLMEDSEHEC